MRRREQLIPCVTVAKREGTEGQHFVCQDEQMVTNDGKLERRPPAELWSAHRGPTRAEVLARENKGAQTRIKLLKCNKV